MKAPGLRGAITVIGYCGVARGQVVVGIAARPIEIGQGLATAAIQSVFV